MLHTRILTHTDRPALERHLASTADTALLMMSNLALAGFDDPVERMISRGPLQRQQMKNLKVYKGSDHPHEAQQPEALDVGALNRKNKRTA